MQVTAIAMNVDALREGSYFYTAFECNPCSSQMKSDTFGNFFWGDLTIYAIACAKMQIKRKYNDLLPIWQCLIFDTDLETQTFFM